MPWLWLLRQFCYEKLCLFLGTGLLGFIYGDGSIHVAIGGFRVYQRDSGRAVVWKGRNFIYYNASKMSNVVRYRALFIVTLLL